MPSILPFDPRPSQAHPVHRERRKEIEKKNPGFGWIKMFSLGLAGITLFMNIEKEVEKHEKKHKEREARQRNRDGPGRGEGGRGRSATGARDDEDRRRKRSARPRSWNPPQQDDIGRSGWDRYDERKGGYDERPRRSSGYYQRY